MRVIGYIRVSTTEQEASLVVQREAIQAEAERRGWQLVDVIEDRCSGKSMDRPGMQRALGMLRTRRGDVLMAHKIDRLSRSLLDFASLLALSAKESWQLVALDLGVDTTNPHGKFMAQIMAAVAELEREMISQRTKDALAAKRAQGIHTGRRSALPDEVVERIVSMRKAGDTIRRIAQTLNEEGVPTGQGAPVWTRTSVYRVLDTVRARALLAS